ncbi:MAG: hypothetical protein KAG53_07410 [Endozoicomonadaceae bacterium]|nr:hypothetical protein [Endozoicomonadaceae bacterium]
MPSSNRLRQRFDEDASALMLLINDSLAEVVVAKLVKSSRQYILRFNRHSQELRSFRRLFSEYSLY